MKRLRLVLVLVAACSVARAGDEEPAAPAAAPAPVDVAGFWTADELRRIDEGLAVVNASRADLGFQKQPIDDPFRLDVVRRALDDPLSVGGEAAEWDAVAHGGDPAVVLRRALDLVSGGNRFEATMSGGADAVDHLPAAAAQPFRVLVNHTLTLGDVLLVALAPLKERREAVLRAALKSQVESSAAPPGATVISDADFLAAVQTVHRERLLWPANELVQSVQKLVAAIRSSAGDTAWIGTERIEDEFGAIVISGYGDDVHDEGNDVAIVIDLGGDDTWTHGASASALTTRPISIAIDLSGDDRYVGGNDFSFGGALGGVAINWDCGGNDTYIAGNCSLGAGILGVGVLVDEGGDDVFRAKDFCEGAGAYGIGVLLKKGGNDLYHADLYGQGYATTWGCGVLADLAGNDTYDAGGAHVHAPLFRDRYQSLSQGFAIGSRPDASGGVGVLVDVAGNDRYVADIYAQGSSYWYSMGLLIDDDGHDTYVAGQYSCGSGIHLSAGMLLDRAGNDSYHCLNGVGVGGAHDFAVGFLVDRAGDDHYSGSGGSQGGALTNSVAMLIDDAGDDGYCAVRGGSQGVATQARSSGGIGLLLDGGGADVYSEKTRNDGVWLADTVGAGIDEPSVSTATGEPQAAAISKEDATAKVEAEGRTAKDGGEPQWDLDKLWKLASEWEVNDNRVIVPIARERLWALGAPALERALEQLGSGSVGSGLGFRAVEATVVHFAAEGQTVGGGRAAIVPRLLEKTRDADVAVRKGAVSLLATLKATESVDRLVEMLTTDEPTRRQVLAALGAMKKAPPAVIAMLRTKKELEGVNAAVCLGAAAGSDENDASVAALLGALGEDTPYLVRTAATEQLAALGDKSIAGLTKLAEDEKAPVMARRNALRAIGKCKHPNAVDPIKNSFQSGDRWVRLSAYQAAAAYIPTANAVDKAELEQSLGAARNMESDPLLKRLR